MAVKPRPLLETWRELNRERDGAPSTLLKQVRADAEGLRRWAEQPHIRKMGETLRRFQENSAVERLMGRMRPAPPLPPVVSIKPKRGGGRKCSFTLEQQMEGIRILRDEGRMSIDAAVVTLKAAGIEGKRSAVYEWIWAPAYASKP